MIRQLMVSDAAIVSELVEANLDHIAPWMQWAEHEPLSIRDRRELIAGWNESGDHSFGIYVDKNADESGLVGICGLTHLPPSGTMSCWARPNLPSGVGPSTAGDQYTAAIAFATVSMSSVETSRWATSRAVPPTVCG